MEREHLKVLESLKIHLLDDVDSFIHYNPFSVIFASLESVLSVL